MTRKTHDIAAQRAERDREAALSASRRARSLWWDEQKPEHCFGCSAPVPEDHKRGDPLPCGH